MTDTAAHDLEQKGAELSSEQKGGEVGSDADLQRQPSALEGLKRVTSELQRKAGFAGGLLRDIQRRKPYFWSDWTDAFTDGNLQQSTSSICFMFFACLAPAIAFGTIYDIETEGQLGVVENILSSALPGVVYAIFSGQPLCILGATGPNLAYTVAFFKICKSMDLDFLTARVWQGIWCSLFCILFAVTGASTWMANFTRYVEEIFSALISAIFIVEALKSVIDTYYRRDGEAAFLTTLLCFSTYILAMQLKSLKTKTILNKSLRFTISSFAVSIAILTVTAVAQIWKDVDIEWLQVPSKFAPTMTVGDFGPSRPWFINPFGGQGLNAEGIKRDLPTWAIFFTIIPGLGMAMLKYLEQNVCTKLMNRPASGLKKPGAYHLDMLVLGVIIYPVVSVLGLPFPCAATVRSLAHLISLTTYEDQPIPGGGTRKVVSKVVEQRWTNFAIHVLLLLSLVLSSVLKNIPTGVLFGVFLFMGITSITGNQLFERMFLWANFDPGTYPRLPYVTRVKTRRLHLFTFIQFLCLAILYGLKAVKQTAMFFPFFIALLVYVRKGLGRYFTDEELSVLDAEEELAPDPVRMISAALAELEQASISADINLLHAESELISDSTPDQKQGAIAVDGKNSKYDEASGEAIAIDV
eukprot:gnl/TRDRNA2_/TRDRNA2_176238_c0_seq1.p1 gnl/TRDRNA2_/TRDRNA2_176238_c0~~gnl/TRDRNA2_/TRDRNA2_176238_c0_seq1.p1  ORF type:complete len:651 (-),score=89.92 gnl/TRDRNA2_/TRDRNA2_176238_c0_seq1:416-2329(-)